MTFLLFAVLLLTEIGFAVSQFSGRPTKKSWTVRRLIVCAAELLTYLLLLPLPGIDFSFRFKLLVLILLLRIAVGGILALAFRKNKNEKKKAMIILSALLSLLLLAASLAPAFIFADYQGRKTTGRYAVGTAAAILIDSSRMETYETDGSYREVPVHLYFPSDYAADNDGSGMHRLPIVIFSHGAFGYYQSNTSTYMELASHGYVVASLDHPYHSFFTEDSAGKTVLVNPEFIQTAMAVGGGSNPYSEEETFKITSEWMGLRIADMNFVLDTLKEAADGTYTGAWHYSDDSRDRIEEIMSLADSEEIGLIGHSLGGATAVTVGRRGDVNAVVDLDGTMLGEQTGVENGNPVVNEDPYETPLLVINNEEHQQEAIKAERAGYSYANNVILSNAKDGYVTCITGAGHMNYTDLPLFSPFLAGLLGTGSVDAGTCVDQMNALVLSFFDSYLKDTGGFSVQERY